ISGNTLQEKCTFQDDQADIKFIDYITKDHIVFQKFLVELKVVYRVFLEAYKEKNTTTKLQLSKEIKKAVFTEAYKLFFNGLNKYEKADSYEDYINLGIKSLKKIRDKHRKDGSKKFDNFYKGINDKDKTLWVKLNFEPFKGYLHFLPQYYRNLYSIVKYVVNENKAINLTEEKINYLRILRSTMSEYEQTLLFYNWYSGMGTAWEGEDDKGNINKFFTEFKMIHNLNKMALIDTELEVRQIFNFIEDKEFKEMFENYSHFLKLQKD